MSTTPAETVAAKIQAYREASELCWEQAADTADNDKARAEFEAEGEACDDLYEQAIEQLEAVKPAHGESSEELLEQARYLEAKGGDDQHARDAIEAVALFRAEGVAYG